MPLPLSLLVSHPQRHLRITILRGHPPPQSAIPYPQGRDAHAAVAAATPPAITLALHNLRHVGTLLGHHACVRRAEARMPLSLQQRFRLGEVSFDPVLQTVVYNHVFEVVEEREKEEEREAQVGNRAGDGWGRGRDEGGSLRRK